MNPTQHASMILVCTYNEKENLAWLLESIAKVAPYSAVLIVDDGSPDGTAQFARDLAKDRDSWTVIDRGAKKGLGSAILDGLRYAIERDYRWVVNLDADRSHDPHEIPSLIAQAQAQSPAIVIGSRYVKGGGLKNCGWKRHLVSKGANAFARIMLGWSIRDCSSAYRCYNVPFLRSLPLDRIECRGYGFLEEILWWILRKGGEAIEHPIVYTEREHGASKISTREAWGTARTILRLACYRASPFFKD